MTERRALAATAVAAAVVPLAAHGYLRARIDHGLAPALSRLTGKPASIGSAEVGWTGALRLTDVAVGDLIHVSAIEAAVAPGRLLAGELDAIEIRMTQPRLRTRIGGDLERLQRWISSGHAGAVTPQRPARRRRIVVRTDTIEVELPGVGVVRAEDVEVGPQGDGYRLVTGAVAVHAGVGPATVTARFARAAADLSGSAGRRLLMIGGDVAVTAGYDTRKPASAAGSAEPGAPTLAIEHAYLRGDAGSVLLHGDVVDGPARRPLTLAAGADHVRIEVDALPAAALAGLLPPGFILDDARVSGAAVVSRSSAGLHVEASATIDDAVVDHPAVADTAVPLDLTATVDVVVGGAEIEVRNVQASLGDLSARAAGRVRRGRAGAFSAGTLELAIERAGCLALLESLPAPILGPLAGLTLDGDAAANARLDVDLDRAPGDGVHLDVDVDLQCQALAEAPAADPRRLVDRGASRACAMTGGAAVCGDTGDESVRLADVPRVVAGAFVAAEDARFFLHHGFDVGQIARSLEVNLREGRLARGGSTITQQLVKNLFLSPRRSLDRKLQEAILTWRVESTLDKRAILEHYLGAIELGPGIRGVAAASRHWFGKPAAQLTAKQAAFLAALTPAPHAMSARVARAGALDAASAQRVDAVLVRMQRAGVITEAEATAARAEPLRLEPGALRVIAAVR